MINFKNKYGSLQLQVVGDYKDVSTIYSKDLNADVFFSIGDAEKIALITDNYGIQLSYNMGRKMMWVIHHKSPSIAAVCKVVSLDFDSKVNATQELDRPNPYRGPIY